MKTPTLRKYESKLIEVNDQLCFFLFSDSESYLHINKASLNNEQKYTTEIFSDNKFSERLNIKLADLTAFRERSFHTLVGMSFIAATEYLIAYIESIETYHSLVSPSSEDSINHEQPEEQLQLKLSGWQGFSYDSAVIKTLKYLRLRRNHIVHLSEEIGDGLNSLIKNDGHLLNKYWRQKPTKLNDFDFSKKDYLSFSVNEIFALINLARVCMRILDKAVLNTLDKRDIAKLEMSEFQKNTALQGLDDSRRVRKFRAYIKHKYGISIPCSEDEYTSFIQNS